MRLLSLIAAALATLLIAACGGDDVPSGEQASEQARELAQQTRALQEQVSQTARSLVDDPDTARERALGELAEQEQRARDLAKRAESDLPEDEEAREALKAANERTAEAAGQLREFASSNRETTLKQARAALNEGEQQLRSASSTLLRDAPDEARRALEDARERLPAIPTP